MEYLSAKKFVVELLAANGWTAIDAFGMQHTYAIARKYYETAVGSKECILYFLPKNEDGFKLTGEYQSEGRNVLSTTWHYITEGQISGNISSGINEFSGKVDADVDQSYARRLFLSRA